MSQSISINQEPRFRAWDENAFNRSFHHEFARTGNVRIHYVIGGNGPLVTLLHGFPQNWREWRLVMPALVDAGYAVVAPDLRGFGHSDKPLDGFDVGTVAEDIRQVVAKLGRDKEKVRVVRHDVGSAVAYAWAATHPEQVEQLVLMEGLPAGLEPQAAGTPMLQGKPLWHLAFGMTPDVPERLLADRELTGNSEVDPRRTTRARSLDLGSLNVPIPLESLAARNSMLNRLPKTSCLWASFRLDS